MDATTQLEPFVDANAIAAYLKVTRRQVLEMTRQGLIPGYPLGIGSSRRLWRYKLSEVDASINTRGIPFTITQGTDLLAADGQRSTMTSGSPRGQRRKR
jgi:Helix-turn-helix domain